MYNSRIQIPPSLARVSGIRQLQEPNSIVNVRLPLFETPAEVGAAAVAAVALPRLAGSRRARVDLQELPVFDLFSNPRIGRTGVRPPSPEERIREARSSIRGLLAGKLYQGLDDLSSPVRPPAEIGPNGTPMTVVREPLDIQHPMSPQLRQAVVVLQSSAAAIPGTPPRGTDGKISSKVAFIVPRTVPNLCLS